MNGKLSSTIDSAIDRARKSGAELFWAVRTTDGRCFTEFGDADSDAYVPLTEFSTFVVKPKGDRYPDTFAFSGIQAGGWVTTRDTYLGDMIVPSGTFLGVKDTYGSALVLCKFRTQSLSGSGYTRYVVGTRNNANIERVRVIVPAVSVFDSEARRTINFNGGIYDCTTPDLPDPIHELLTQ